MVLRRVTAFVVAILVLWACAPGQAATASPIPSLPAVPATQAPATLAPASVASAVDAPQNCYYAWATQDLPSLTRKLQSELDARHSGIVGSAYAFGENCNHEDGTSTFLPMETDFRVRIPVKALSDEVVLGNWIAQVMETVEALPPSELVGPRPGRIEFEFSVNSQPSLRMIVEIARYRDEAIGLPGAELFRHFHPAP